MKALVALLCLQSGPVIGNDWKAYKDTPELRAAKLFWWFDKTRDANEHVDIVPDATFGQVCRIMFPANDKGIGSAPRLATKLPQPLENVWLRVRVKWTPGWTTKAPDPPGHANAYKMLFWLWEGCEGRGQIEISNTTQYILECGWKRPGEKIALEKKPLPGSQNFGHVTTEWTDGEWYEFVIHFEKTSETSARQRWWRRRLTEKGVIADNAWVFTGIEIRADRVPRVRAVELGANKNKNNPETMHLAWGPWEVQDGSRVADPFGLEPNR